MGHGTARHMHVFNMQGMRVKWKKGLGTGVKGIRRGWREQSPVVGVSLIPARLWRDEAASSVAEILDDDYHPDGREG